jgi:lipopolysaccharide/colanic/teichoic acid biosynthesis glycosyltransferase
MAKSVRRPIGIPRPIEALLALIGLLVLAPLYVLAALLIKIGSTGPILFRQTRVGLHGEGFTLFKFRTMTVQDKPGSLVTAAGDSRITGIGRLLRKSKIDELPELWNVLRGDMSFVGPRPEVPQYVDLSDPRWLEVLTHRPGITDPVTLRLRNEEDLLAAVRDTDTFYREVVQPYKLRGYLKFVRDKSWKTDIRIIGRTLKAIAIPRSATPPSREEMQLSFVD